MTIAQWKTPEVPLPILFVDPEDIQPVRYSVMVYKLKGKWNEFYLGFVVTHLSLHDWCSMKGYKLVNVYQGTRLAQPGEKTDLI